MTFVRDENKTLRNLGTAAWRTRVSGEFCDYRVMVIAVFPLLRLVGR